MRRRRREVNLKRINESGDNQILETLSRVTLLVKYVNENDNKYNKTPHVIICGQHYRHIHI